MLYLVKHFNDYFFQQRRRISIFIHFGKYIFFLQFTHIGPRYKHAHIDRTHRHAIGGEKVESNYIKFTNQRFGSLTKDRLHLQPSSNKAVFFTCCVFIAAGLQLRTVTKAKLTFAVLIFWLRDTL